MASTSQLSARAPVQLGRSATARPARRTASARTVRSVRVCAAKDPWWMFGMGGLFNGDKEEISGGGVATLEKPKAALARGSVEGLPRTYYDNYTAEDGKMGKDADGFYFLKEDQRVKINPFEKTKIAKDPIKDMCYTNAIELMAKSAAVDFAALDDEDNTQIDMRLKYVGLFHRRKATYGRFMMRVRLPNGIITAAAMKYMGELCATYGDDGCSDITTRQNMQLRGILLEDVPEIFKRLAEFNITTTQSGMDNVRNIVGSPLAGIDVDEIVDTREYCYLMNDYIADLGKGHKEISHLPRKFNVSIVGSHDLYEHPHINDIAYMPATKDGVFGFNVIFGGFFSAVACKESISLDVFVTPEQMVPVCHATLTAFRDFGARQNRQKTRVMYLIEEMGPAGFRAELEKRMGVTLATEGESLIDPNWKRRSYYGVNKQKDGNNYVGVCIPAGRMSPDDMMAVAHLAETYGDGDIRLTVEQNLVLSGVPDAKVEELLAQPILAKLQVNPGSLSAGLVSCPGSQFCGFGMIETKGNALKLTSELEELLHIPPGVRIHWTGCPNSCGQAQVADIGLLGTTAKGPNGPVPAVEIFTGGRIGWDSHLADTYKSKVPLTELVAELSELLIANHGATRK